jgi:hypothetical protein
MSNQAVAASSVKTFVSNSISASCHNKQCAFDGDFKKPDGIFPDFRTGATLRKAMS